MFILWSIQSIGIAIGRWVRVVMSVSAWEARMNVTNDSEEDIGLTFKSKFVPLLPLTSRPAEASAEELANNCPRQDFVVEAFGWRYLVATCGIYGVVVNSTDLRTEASPDHGLFNFWLRSKKRKVVWLPSLFFLD